MNKIRTFLYIAALLLLVISASAEEEFSQAIPVDSDQPVVSTVSLHSAGKLLITSGDDHVVRVWDLASGVQIKQLKVIQDGSAHQRLYPTPVMFLQPVTMVVS